MKKKFYVLLMVVAVVLAGLLTGCSKNDETKATAVALIVGNHANAEPLKLDSDIITTTVHDAVRYNGHVSVISVDGDPDVVINKDYDLSDTFKNASSSKLDAIASAELEDLISIIDDVKADSEEIDTLKAIVLAVRALKEAPDSAEKIIVIADTGLSTTGLLNFNNNLLTADPNEIVKALQEKEAIPDLTGIQVYWQQMGDVAAPQTELSDKQRNALTDIWSAIISAGGGEFHDEAAVSIETAETDTYPTVTAVNVGVETPLSFDGTTEISKASFSEPLSISEETIGFKGDSPEYVDSNAAMSVLTPIADYMKSDTGFSLLIVGSCAGDTETGFTKNLSQQRADAVKNSLVSLGVEGSRIRTKGMGISDPWHIQNVGTEGELAAKNRKVVLLDAASSTAQSI